LIPQFNFIHEGVEKYGAAIGWVGERGGGLTFFG
jgi:hypothetical protein